MRTGGVEVLLNVRVDAVEAHPRGGPVTEPSADSSDDDQLSYVELPPRGDTMFREFPDTGAISST